MCFSDKICYQWMEDDEGDSVVEERLSENENGERFGHIQVLEHGQNGHL